MKFIVPQNFKNGKMRYCGTPLKYSFSEASQTKTAVLVEMAFIDNEEDHAMLSNDLDAIVRAIARGITDYAGGQ